jgi:hypothetical protein
MNEIRYAVDTRTAEQVRRHLLAAARRSYLPRREGDQPTWASVVFDGSELSDPTEPSQALLEAVVQLHTGLAAHLNTVPRRILAEWLRGRLGIEPLPAVADRVVVAATADPARTPIAIAAGAVVRAKDSAGKDRRYETTETLTVHGAELLDVRSYRARTDVTGVADTAAGWDDRDAPFVPFAATPVAAHSFAVISDLLAFEGGEMSVRLTFEGGDARQLDGATWTYPSVDGPAPARLLRSSATEIDLVLTGSVVPDAAFGEPVRYLRASFPAGGVGTGPLSFAFTSITLRVLDRPDLAPDGAYYNDGRLDVTKEFQPFGPAARRGDAFYVASEEAFSKPLNFLTVELQLLAADGSLDRVVWGADVPTWKRRRAEGYRDEVARRLEEDAPGYTVFDDIFELLEPVARPRIDWERYDGRSWAFMRSTPNRLETVTWEPGSVSLGPTSEPTEPGGERLVRAFLADGDFGWTDYQRRVGQFAADAAGEGPPDPTDLIPPDPPIVSRIMLRYKTRGDEPDGVVSVDGWARRERVRGASGPFRPFAVPLETSGGDAGMVAIGLRLGEAGLGASVSLALDVESAAACGADAPGSLQWEYWSTAEGWRALDVADGTLGLRQSGLVRFVAPLDWGEGSSAVSAGEGRWIRAVTDMPDRIGTIRSIVPDAVEAVDLVPAAEPLEPKQVKGLLVPLAGLKKVTNERAGTAGRHAEDEESLEFLERAAGAVRHRWRSIQSWDYEELVRTAFPEVAVVRCLPTTRADGGSAPGSVGLVVIPQSAEPMPLPSVSLAERIRASLAPRLPVHARPAVLCPLYVPVTVSATLILMRGVAAVDARRTIGDALERLLHPTSRDPVGFGRELFASTVSAYLEARPEVDHIEAFSLSGPDGPTERVTVDACRGLVASSGSHALVLEEQP